MVSDEERREIAAKLRALEPWVHLGASEPITREEVEDALGFEYSIGDSYDAAGIHRLADLIDRPVTRNLSEKPEFVCELCGAVWPYDLGFTHCLECGAKVVDE